MARMTGGRAIVRSIIEHGVDTIFGLPGIQLDHLFNALYDERNSVRVIHPRHEQAAGYMAYGYAQSTGKPGVYAVVPGPGLLNTTAALATAYGCYAPVLALTGQIPSAAIGQGYGLLHEIPQQLETFRTLTRWADRIAHTSLAPRMVQEAFRQMLSGARRPVGLEMALDLLPVEAEVDIGGPIAIDRPPVPDSEAINDAASLLGKAKQPLIVVGGGAQEAGEAVQAIADMLQAPVVSNRQGRGVVSDKHYLSVTQMAGHRLWEKTDAVLAVGTRLQQHRMVWGVDADLPIVRIDIDPTQMHRLGAPRIGIVADAHDALTELANALGATNQARVSREEEITTLNAGLDAVLEEKLQPQIDYVKAMREALPEDGLFVDELTQVGYVARGSFPVYSPRSFIASGYQGTLGSGYATALGVKVAHPDRPVLSVNGDGGFMFNVQELSTAVHHGIDVVAVVFNDRAYGNVKRMQEDLHGGRVIATDLRNPDFPALAEAFGMHGETVNSPQALRTAIEQAFVRGGPALIEVPLGKVGEPFGISMPTTKVRG